MAQIIRLQDPVARVIEYLGSFVPETAGPFLQVPANWAWDDLLVTITDVGGDGERHVILDAARLMVEVWHPDSMVASGWCRDLHRLISAWRDSDYRTMVTVLRTVRRRTCMPEEASSAAGFLSSVDLISRVVFRETQNSI